VNRQKNDPRRATRFFQSIGGRYTIENGIEMSVTMTSGFSLMAASKSDWPSTTLPTTSNFGRNNRSTMSGKAGWSSAKSIVGLLNRCASESKKIRSRS
jgi:hypothetical protein